MLFRVLSREQVWRQICVDCLFFTFFFTASLRLITNPSKRMSEREGERERERERERHRERQRERERLIDILSFLSSVGIVRQDCCTCCCTA